MFLIAIKSDLLFTDSSKKLQLFIVDKLGIPAYKQQAPCPK